MLKLKDLQEEYVTGYSTEGIDHQYNSTFGKELEDAIFLIQQKNAHPHVISDATTVLAAIINKHTNLNMTVSLFDMFNCMANIPDINKNNVLIRGRPLMISSKRSTDSLKYICDNGLFEGNTNLQTGSVSGDFSKIPVQLIVGNSMLYSTYNLASSELAAVILHEVGHIFTVMEMAKRLTITNYIMEEGTQRLLTANTKDQRLVILADIESVTGIAIADKEKLAIKRKTADAYRIIILQTETIAINQQLDIKLYDLRSCEQLADRFVSRHGYGRQLALALDKVNLLSGRSNHALMPLLTFLLLLNTVFQFIQKLIKRVTVVNAAIIVGKLIYTLLTMSNPFALIYDPPKLRILKLQQQINDALKDQSISNEIKGRYIDDFYAIQNIINSTYIDYTFYTVVYTYITPKGRQSKSLIDVQEELEALYNNNLFIAGTELDINLK